MAQFVVEKLTYTYPNQKTPALKDISFEIKQGEFILVCGSSGSGKTTLLRQLNKDLLPSGDKVGEVKYLDKSFREIPKLSAISQVGMVFQDPESQIVMDRVSDEIAFSLENIAMEPERIRIRIAELATYFGIDDIINRKIATLSGGQKQLVNLCSVLALRPNVLIFDEPTSRLDPLAAKEFIKMIHLLNQELGLTIIMSEHRLDEVISYADKIIMLDKGEMSFFGKINDFTIYANSNIIAKQYLPKLSVINELLDKQEIPLNVKEVRAMLSGAKISKFIEPKVDEGNEEILLTTTNLTFSYDINEGYVLKDMDLAVKCGDFISLLGANATGKSTLLKTLAGILKPQSGKIKYKNKRIKKKSDLSDIAYVAQNPILHFSKETVREELFSTDDKEYTDSLIKLFELFDVLDHHPYDLSGGQQQKLAIILAMQTKPNLLLLDEPTKGLDPISKESFAKQLKVLNEQGVTIICATHDLDFAAENTNKCIMLFDTQIIYQGNIRDFLADNNYYTTNINLALKRTEPRCISEKDVKLWANQ
jgi:energy-coupling factor transport system ATP-binding protein